MVDAVEIKIDDSDEIKPDSNREINLDSSTGSKSEIGGLEIEDKQAGGGRKTSIDLTPEQRETAKLLAKSLGRDVKLIFADEYKEPAVKILVTHAKAHLDNYFVETDDESCNCGDFFLAMFTAMKQRALCFVFLLAGILVFPFALVVALICIPINIIIIPMQWIRPRKGKNGFTIGGGPTNIGYCLSLCSKVEKTKEERAPCDGNMFFAMLFNIFLFDLSFHLFKAGLFGIFDPISGIAGLITHILKMFQTTDSTGPYEWMMRFVAHNRDWDFDWYLKKFYSYIINLIWNFFDKRDFTGIFEPLIPELPVEAQKILGFVAKHLDNRGLVEQIGDVVEEANDPETWNLAKKALESQIGTVKVVVKENVEEYVKLAEPKLQAILDENVLKPVKELTDNALEDRVKLEEWTDKVGKILAESNPEAAKEFRNATKQMLGKLDEKLALVVGGVDMAQEMIKDLPETVSDGINEALDEALNQIAMSVEEALV